MPKFEIKIDAKDSRNLYGVFNGKEDINGSFIKNIKQYQIYDKKIQEEVTKYSINNLKSHFDSIKFESNFMWLDDFWLEYLITFQSELDADSWLIIEIKPDIEGWENIYSVESLANSINKEVSKSNIQNIQYCQNNDSYKNGFGIQIKGLNQTIPLNELIYRFTNVLESAYLKAKRKLLNLNLQNIILLEFNFPPKIKSACNQYLLHFGKFLFNFGVEANISIREDVNKILFSVNPKNGKEALGNIYRALKVYLEVPSSVIISYDNNDQKNIQILEWEANIHHFKSQLALAKATLEMKDSTIELLKLKNSHYESAINKYKVIEAFKKDENTESIAGGLIKVEEYKGKGISINLPEIYRKLKKLFIYDE